MRLITLDPNDDVAAGIAVLHRVRDQVAKDLSNSHRIDEYLRAVVSVHQLHATLARQLRKAVDGFLDDDPRIHPALLEAESVCLEEREIEEIVHHPRENTRGPGNPA